MSIACRSLRSQLLPLAAVLSLGFATSSAMAQGSSLFNSGSSGSANSSSAAATSAASSAAAGATGGGSSGGGAASGASQLAVPEFAQFGAAAQGATGFIGLGDATQFTGNRSAGQQTIDAGGTTRFSGGGSGSSQASGEVETRAKLIRVQQRLSFPQQPVVGATLKLNLDQQFTALASRFPSIGVEVDSNGQAILSGAVDSDEDRKLAALIVRLEPGIRKVVNNLQLPAAPLDAPH